MRLRGNPSDLSCEELNIAVLTFDEKSYILHLREIFEIWFEICPSLILSAADAIRTYSSKLYPRRTRPATPPTSITYCSEATFRGVHPNCVVAVLGEK